MGNELMNIRIIKTFLHNLNASYLKGSVLYHGVQIPHIVPQQYDNLTNFSRER